MTTATTSAIFTAAHKLAVLADKVVAYRIRFSNALKSAWAAAKKPFVMTPQEAYEQLAATNPSRFKKGEHDAFHAYFPTGSNWQESNRAAHAYADELRQREGVYDAGVYAWHGVDGSLVWATMDTFRTEVVEPNAVKMAELRASIQQATETRKAENQRFIEEAQRTGKTVFIREYTLHEDGDFVYCKDFAKPDGRIVTSSERDGNG